MTHISYLTAYYRDNNCYGVEWRHNVGDSISIDKMNQLLGELRSVITNPRLPDAIYFTSPKLLPKECQDESL